MNDKNKVRVCFPFVGDSIGGSHLSSIELIKALDKSKFDIKLLVHKKGVLSKHLVSEGIKPIFLEVKNFVGQKKGIIINFLNIFSDFFLLKFGRLLYTKSDIQTIFSLKKDKVL